jgi:hypothetical protein
VILKNSNFHFSTAFTAPLKERERGEKKNIYKDIWITPMKLYCILIIPINRRAEELHNLLSFRGVGCILLRYNIK